MARELIVSGVCFVSFQFHRATAPYHTLIVINDGISRTLHNTPTQTPYRPMSNTVYTPLNNRITRNQQQPMNLTAASAATEYNTTAM